MNLLSRKASDTAPLADEPETPAGAGKNAPTRTRAQARAARAQKAKGVPRTRAERSARVRQIRAETTESLKSTDPAQLPKNERVPELVFARDQIDTRRNLGSSILVVVAVYFVGTTVAGSVRSGIFQTSILFLSLFWFLGIITDTMIASRTIERRIQSRWPGSTVKTRGYVFRRAVTLKRWRRPVVRPVPEQNRWDHSGF